jgi:hypothetical protein
LLRTILKAEIPLSTIITDSTFDSSEEADEVLKALQRSAIDIGRVDVATDIGAVRHRGQPEHDPLDGVPEVQPVTRASKAVESESETPFNLQTLRYNLGQVASARRALHDDATAQQKVLEESAYDAAFQRLKHEQIKMDSLGLGQNLTKPSLQRWMWEWYGKLTARITAEVEALKEQESNCKLFIRPLTQDVDLY